MNIEILFSFNRQFISEEVIRDQFDGLLWRDQQNVYTRTRIERSDLAYLCKCSFLEVRFAQNLLKHCGSAIPPRLLGAINSGY
jgi:hypothetical protein